MGRKKKKKNTVIFCYYCDRHFDNEKVLIEHQRGKHFKCPICRRRLSSARGVMIHVFQVHKQSMDSVPHSKEGRDGFDLEIFGMVNVPLDLIQEKMIKIHGEPAAKKQRIQQAQTVIQIPGISRSIPFNGLPQRMNMLGTNILQPNLMMPNVQMLNQGMRIQTGMPPTGVRLQPINLQAPQTFQPMQAIQGQPFQPQISHQGMPPQPFQQIQPQWNPMMPIQQQNPQVVQQRIPIQQGTQQQIVAPQAQPPPGQAPTIQPQDAIARQDPGVNNVVKKESNKKKIIRIYDLPGFSMEEQRAAHPKYQPPRETQV